MRLRAIITIDIDAADFVDAAEHQRRIETQLRELRAIYANAELSFRERRQSRRATPEHAAERVVEANLSRTGNLHSYVD